MSLSDLKIKKKYLQDKKREEDSCYELTSNQVLVKTFFYKKMFKLYFPLAYNITMVSKVK